MAKIKIIDDDKELAEYLTIELKKEGHSVTTLNKTDEAVHDLVQEKPDLVILDVMFPDNPAGGFELAREIRKTRETRDLPIILLTGVNQEYPTAFFSTDDIDNEWMPVHDFIEKPVDIQKLFKKVRELLQASGG